MIVKMKYGDHGHSECELNPLVREYFQNALEYFLQEAEETEAARVSMVDWIIGAITIEIQCLWAGKTGSIHTCGVDLRESSLLRIVMAIDGIVQACRRAAVVGSESSISRAGGFGIECRTKWERDLFERSAVTWIRHQSRPKMIGVMIFNRFPA